MTKAKTHGRRRPSKIITTASADAIIAIALSTTQLLSTVTATTPDTYVNNEWEPYQDEGILDDSVDDIEASLSSLGGRRNRLLDHRNSKNQEISGTYGEEDHAAYINKVDYFIEEGILGEDTSEEDRQLAAAVGQRKKVNKQRIGINNNKKKNIDKLGLDKLSTDSRDDESSILSGNIPHHVSKKKNKVANRVSATQNKKDKKASEAISNIVSTSTSLNKKNKSLQKKKKAMVSRQKQNKKKILSTGGGDSNNKNNNNKKIGTSIKKKKGQKIGNSIKKKKKKFATTGNNWKKKENGWSSKSSKGKGGKGKWSRVRDSGGGGRKGNDWISDIDIDYGHESSSNDKWRNPAELCTCMKWDTINNWNKNDNNIGWYAAAASGGSGKKKSSSSSASNFAADKNNNRELGWDNDGWERVCKTWECSPTLSPTLSP